MISFSSFLSFGYLFLICIINSYKKDGFRLMDLNSSRGYLKNFYTPL